MVDEKQLHESLKADAKEIFESCYDQWKRAKAIKPLGIAWPGAGLKTDNGTPIEDGDVCACELPEDVSKCAKVMSNMAIRTNAVAILYFYQLPDKVYAHFESYFGAARWEMPINVCAGVASLGSIVEHRTDGLLLFKEKRGQA